MGIVLMTGDHFMSRKSSKRKVAREGNIIECREDMEEEKPDEKTSEEVPAKKTPKVEEEIEVMEQRSMLKIVEMC